MTDDTLDVRELTELDAALERELDDFELDGTLDAVELLELEETGVLDFEREELIFDELELELLGAHCADLGKNAQKSEFAATVCVPVTREPSNAFAMMNCCRITTPPKIAVRANSVKSKWTRFIRVVGNDVCIACIISYFSDFCKEGLIIPEHSPPGAMALSDSYCLGFVVSKNLARKQRIWE